MAAISRHTGLRAIEVEGRAVPVRLRTNARARNIVMRLDPAIDGLALTLPEGVAEAEAEAFVRRQSGWVLARLSALPPRVPFTDGARVPLMGVAHTVRHRPGERGTVWRQGSELHVAGGADHLARRLTDWMKAEARRETRRRAEAHADAAGLVVGRVHVRDPKARWGSCSSRGDLSFSWRLILAPERVLDYVVAHEVAHLAHMDHSPRFWRVVDALVPDAKTARAWLKRHGTALHRYG